MSVSGMALQLIFMKGPYLRLLRKCIELATSSLPVPVSPIMRTEVFEVLATVSMRLLTSFKALDEPTISGQSLLPSSAGFTEGLKLLSATCLSTAYLIERTSAAGSTCPFTR